MKLTGALNLGIRGLQAMIDEVERRPYGFNEQPATRPRRARLVREYRAAQAALKALRALIEEQP